MKRAIALFASQYPDERAGWGSDFGIYFQVTSAGGGGFTYATGMWNRDWTIVVTRP